MKIQPRQSEKGFVTFMVLAMLLIMVTLLSINSATLIRLRREMKALEKQQMQRIASSTNQPSVRRQ